MANRSRNGGESSAWLPQEAGSRSTNGTGDHGLAETTSRWLLDEREPPIAAPETALEDRDTRLEQTLQEREAEFAQGLRELVEVFRERRAELEGRIRELESALAEAKREANSRRTRTGKLKKGRLDVNTATFEQFRDLGLPVTQCSRIISYRDVRHGFGSLDELDGIPGLPRETQTTLKSQLGI
jgi:hypothetical protein